MGRVADGVSCAGGKITGVVPDYLDVDGAIFEKCTELIITETLRDRKRLMDEKSDAVVAMVGGVGTLEEFMEMLALKQLCRHNKPVVILNTNDYYHHLVKMLEEIIVQKFAKPASADLYYIAKTPAEAIDYIKNYKPTHTVIKKLRYIKTEEEAK